jgi:hypothetical protein
LHSPGGRQTIIKYGVCLLLGNALIKGREREKLERWEEVGMGIDSRFK